MTLPGFTAEVAAGSPASAYAGVFGDGVAGSVVAAALDLHLPVFRCCRRAPLFGNRFVCAQQAHFPTETCTCTATLSGPLITCKGPVFTPF